jgi:hypothetical protein
MVTLGLGTGLVVLALHRFSAGPLSLVAQAKSVF